MNMREPIVFHQDLFDIDLYTGLFRAQYSVLSIRGNRHIFMIGEFAYNYLSFFLEAKSGTRVRYIVRKTTMRDGEISSWFMTPGAYYRDKVPGCDGTRIIVTNDWM